MSDYLPTEDTDDVYQKPSNTWLVPLLAIVVGLAGGWMISTLTQDSPQVVINEAEVPAEEDTAVEEADMLPQRTDRERLEDAQTEVENLKALLAAREGELSRRQEQDEVDAERQAVAARRWRAMEEEIEHLQARLSEAELERDDLIVELRETVQALNEQIEKTERAKQIARHYKRQSVENLWSAFFAEAKVKLCDRGTRRRHRRCHEAVEASLNEFVQDRFTTCVDTYQATPLLLKREDREELPMFSGFLDEEVRFTRGWYIQYCDPTLPEAGDPLEDI